MQVILGKEGLDSTWQKNFPEETPCCRCDGTARIGFVAHETEEEDKGPYVCTLHRNKPKSEGYWVHDACAVAVYFCKKCLETTALYNQA